MFNIIYSPINTVHCYWRIDNAIYLCALRRYDVVRPVASDIRRPSSSSCSWCCRPCSYDGSFPCSSATMALRTFAAPSSCHAPRPLEPSTADCCPPGLRYSGRLSLLGPLRVCWTCKTYWFYCTVASVALWARNTLTEWTPHLSVSRWFCRAECSFAQSVHICRILHRAVRRSPFSADSLRIDWFPWSLRRTVERMKPGRAKNVWTQKLRTEGREDIPWVFCCERLLH